LNLGKGIAVLETKQRKKFDEPFEVGGEEVM
jgi:hypothetical protein